VFLLYFVFTFVVTIFRLVERLSMPWMHCLDYQEKKQLVIAIASHCMEVYGFAISWKWMNLCAKVSSKIELLKIQYFLYTLPNNLHYNFFLIQECSNFVAGSALRSCSRYRALDETSLFGCACRHEFPAKLINLKHGEGWVFEINLYVIINWCLVVKAWMCRMDVGKHYSG